MTKIFTPGKIVTKYCALAYMAMEFSVANQD